MNKKIEQKENPNTKPPEFVDIKLKCVDCSKEFTWFADEQLYYRDRNLVPPKRCSTCRVIRRNGTAGNIRVTQSND